MAKKENSVAPEARQAIYDLRMEIARELSIPTFNTMTASEYPAYMNDFNESENVIKGKKMSINGRIYNHNLY